MHRIAPLPRLHILTWLVALLLVVGLSPKAVLAAESPVWTTEDFGGEPHLFNVAGCRAFVLLPRHGPTGGRIPWVWYAPAIKGYPNERLTWLFSRLLAAGVAIAGIDVGETYASPDTRQQFWIFYQEITRRFPLAPKANLLAQSRGGLNHYAFAAQHPTAVCSIAGIYPVLDLRSYPGLEKAAAAYHTTPAALAAHLEDYNPIANLAPIARARVPILHLHGDSDHLVPIAANTIAAADRYRSLGGNMTVITVPGKGHEEVAEFFESPDLLAFLLRHAQEKH